jgi:hypothetical protein
MQKLGKGVAYLKGKRKKGGGAALGQDKQDLQDEIFPGFNHGDTESKPDGQIFNRKDAEASPVGNFNHSWARMDTDVAFTIND